MVQKWVKIAFIKKTNNDNIDDTNLKCLRQSYVSKSAAILKCFDENILFVLVKPACQFLCSEKHLPLT
jgi:hypothetical protein